MGGGDSEGVSKKPRVGTEYSNEYAAEPAKQGLSEKQIMEKINGRDFQLPDQVMLHYRTGRFAGSVGGGGVYSLTETEILRRFDSKTGKLSYKSRLAPDAGYFTTSPWAYNGRVFGLSGEGKTVVVEAGEGFKLLHTNMQEEMAQVQRANCTRSGAQINT